MEKYLDIHCHLEMCKDSEKVIESALGKGVIIVAQGVDVKSNRKVLEFAEKDKNIKASLGIYPIHILEMSDEDIDAEIEFIMVNRTKISSIGEVGLDFKEDDKEHLKQEKAFRKFVSLSVELDIPIIVHSRKAEERVIQILEEMDAEKVIMHCFCGARKLEERIIKNGWYLTIPTNVTRTQQFQERAKNAPLTQLFCETDSPYLHPDKSGDNEPALVIRAYEEIAKIRKMKISEVKKIIFENYRGLFG